MSDYKELQIDENLRKSNFMFFEARYGFLPRVDKDELEKYRMEYAQNGECTLYIRNATPMGDFRLTSSYSPSYEAKKWADRYVFINRKTTIGLWGIANGAYLQALKEKLRPDTSFFVIEPDEGLFSFVCGFVDFRALIADRNVRFYINDEQKKTLSADMINDVITFRSEARGIITPFYNENQDFLNLCKEIERVATATDNYQKDRGRDALRCRIYSWNHMQKAYLLSDLAKELPKDVTAVIVAAGPSLRKNVEQLRKLKGHAFIICTDRAVSVLDEYGIKPDVVTSLDAQKSASYLDAKITEDVPMICSHQVSIDAQKLYEGRCIYFHQLEYEKYVLGDKIVSINGIDLGGNVAGGSFVVCEMLGIKTIILIGQDLAYLDGKHHADGLNDGDTSELYTREAEGINGETVYTNDMWLAFKDFYEREIRTHQDIRVIDATEGGVKIAGTEIMTLSEAAADLDKCSFNLESILERMPKAQTYEEFEKAIENEHVWINELDDIAEKSKAVETLCEQLLKICRYQDIGDMAAKKKLNKLDKLREQILTSLVYLMMEEFWIEDLYGIPDITFMVRNNEESIPVFENAIRFYHHLPEDCMSLKEELKKALGESE